MSKQKLLLSSKTHFFPATSWLPIFICSSVLKILVSCSLIVLFFCCLFCSINNMPRCSLGDQIFIFTNCPFQRHLFMTATLLILSFHHEFSLQIFFFVQPQTSSVVLRKLIFKTPQNSSEPVCAALFEPDKVSIFSQSPFICLDHIISKPVFLT